MSLVHVEQKGFLVTLTMTHQERRNVLSEALIGEILAGLEQARTVKARCVILRAEPKVAVWSAGHDIGELPHSHRDPLGWGDPLRVVIRAIEEFPAPVIALLEGGVWGGAFEMALACDILVATPEVRFAITPARLGIPYNISGLLTFVNAASLHAVREMVFTAQPISAERAYALGMVNHLQPADRITAFCEEMAAGITRLAPLAIAVMKEELRVLVAAHAITPRMFERVQGLRRQIYDGEDYMEGVRAFKEKRAPHFMGK